MLHVDLTAPNVPFLEKFKKMDFSSILGKNGDFQKIFGNIWRALRHFNKGDKEEP